MARYESRIAAELAALRRESPLEAAFHAYKLCKAGRILRRIAQNQCNGWPRPVRETRDGKVYQYDIENPEWRARDEKRREKQVLIVAGCLRAYRKDVTVEINHDPRGPAVKLRIRNIDIPAE